MLNFILKMFLSSFITLNRIKIEHGTRKFRKPIRNPYGLDNTMSYREYSSAVVTILEHI